MVLAVNCPPQAPSPGQAWSSTSLSASAEIFPALYAPTASNTSWMVRLRLENGPPAAQRPNMMEPQ